MEMEVLSELVVKIKERWSFGSGFVRVVVFILKGLTYSSDDCTTVFTADMTKLRIPIQRTSPKT